MNEPSALDKTIEGISARRNYIGRINGLIGDLQAERSRAIDASAGRNLSLAITHLEDALLRISPSDVYLPNPGTAR